MDVEKKCANDSKYKSQTIKFTMHLQNQKKKNHLRNGYITILISLVISLPGHAVVPYVFHPNTEELQKDSLKFARNAAQRLRFGRPKEAIRLTRLAIQLKPNDYMLWSLLGQAQLQDKKLTEAKESIEKAIQINPNKANLWFASATLSLQKQNPKEALYLIKQGLKLEPKNAHGYFQQGNAFILQKKYTNALASFQKAVSLESSFWEALNNQALILFEQSKVNEAIKKWQEVLEINQDAEPMLALAAALNHTNKTNAKTLLLAKKALSKNPNYVSTKHQKDQLWGDKLRKATSKLLARPDLKTAVERAKANSET